MRAVPQDVRVEALLAEYQSINATVERKTTLVTTLITFHVTAIATVVGFIVSERADDRLLLVVPLISAILGLLISAQDFDIRTAESYVGTVLRPLLHEYGQDDRLWRWHEHLVSRRRLGFVGLTRLAPLGLLFPGAAVGSLAVAVPLLRTTEDRLAWAMGAFLTLVLLLGWKDALGGLSSQLLTGRLRSFRGGRPDRPDDDPIPEPGTPR